MSESLATLLLRLSEAGAPAILWGRQAKPYLGRAFDGLLTGGVLIEQAPATEWPVCAACDCGLGVRPIQVIDDRIIAACPLDANNDAILDADDLRSFVIDCRRLVETIATADESLSLRETTPGLWHLGTTPSGRPLFLALMRSTSSDPALLHVMRSVARGAGITVMAPSLPNDVERRLGDAGDVHVVATVAALTLDDTGRWLINMPQLDARKAEVPRLTVLKSRSTATLDGVDISLPQRPFNLLWLFAETLIEGGGVVSRLAIEQRLWGNQVVSKTAAADAVRDLRQHLRSAVRRRPGEPELIETRHRQGYILTIGADLIALHQ